jgi:phosphate transport system protein
MSAIGRNLNRSMQQALKALEERDTERARKLLADIKGLRRREDLSKEICLQILARTRGTTLELRWTGCAHRILLLMEKSCKEIAEIAQKVTEINHSPFMPPAAEELPSMGRVASRMLQESIRAALQPDAEYARGIMAADSSLDQKRDAFIKRAITFMMENPTTTIPVVPYLLVSKHLEKIGDHASHIAEEVVYYLQEQTR